MDSFRFLNWPLYKDAKKLYSSVLRIVDELPREYSFSAGEQLRRSSLSVVLNVAEGSGRGTDSELKQFLVIAHGSLYETLAALDVLKDNKLVKEEAFQSVLVLIESIANQLGGMRKNLRKTRN